MSNNEEQTKEQSQITDEMQKDKIKEILKELANQENERIIDKSLCKKILEIEQVEAIKILEVLDTAIHGSLANGFVVNVLQIIYEQCLEMEGKKHEDMVPLAHWRERGKNKSA